MFLIAWYLPENILSQPLYPPQKAPTKSENAISFEVWKEKGMLKGNWWIFRFLAKFLSITTQLHIKLYADFAAAFCNITK